MTFWGLILCGKVSKESVIYSVKFKSKCVDGRETFKA